MVDLTKWADVAEENLVELAELDALGVGGGVGWAGFDWEVEWEFYMVIDNWLVEFSK